MERFANRARTNLTNAIDSDDTTLIVDSVTKFPSLGNFRIRIDDEIMLITAVSGSTFTASRAQEGTVAASHPAKSKVEHVLTAGGLVQAISEGGGGNSINTTNTFVKQGFAEVDTSNTTPVQVTFVDVGGGSNFNTIPLPNNSRITINVTVFSAQSGASKSKSWSIQRDFNVNGSGVVTAASQRNVDDPQEVGGSMSASPAINYTGTNARVDWVGIAGTDVRTRLDVQVVTVTAIAFTGATPTISSATPDLSDPAGGTTHVLAGAGFTGSSSLTIGGTNIPSFVIDSDTQITFTMPARAIGANLSVVVTNPSGSNAPNTLFEVWGPEAEACTILWDRIKGPYDGSTWPGVASAGPSAGRDLVQSAASFRPTNASGEPDFDGVDDYLPPSPAVAMSSIFTAAAGSVFCIFDADTADTYVGTINDPGLFIDNATYMGLQFTTIGVTGWLLDGSRKEITLAAAIGQRHATMFRWGTGGGGQLELKVNGNTATPVACGDMDNMTGGVLVGVNYTTAAVLDGRIRTIFCLASTASDALYTKFRKWAQVARGAV